MAGEAIIRGFGIAGAGILVAVPPVILDCAGLALLATAGAATAMRRLGIGVVVLMVVSLIVGGVVHDAMPSEVRGWVFIPMAVLGFGAFLLFTMASTVTDTVTTVGCRSCGWVGTLGKYRDSGGCPVCGSDIHQDVS